MRAHTILIVDDQKINRRILCKLLEKKYQILEADNGQAALEILKKHAEDIAAVLLDIVMPIMDGYEVLAAMQNSTVWSKIPVIVSSQEDGDEAEIRALSLGAQDFIAKPYKGEIICHRLENTIRLRETAAIANRATKDDLTGLYNKRFFIERVEEELHKNIDTAYVLICFGVERFKLVNDTYGVEKGDQLLCYLGKILVEAAGSRGICGRIGSDMFCALVPDKGSYVSADFEPWMARVNAFPMDMDIKLHCGIYNITDHNASAAVMCDWAQLAADKNRGKYDVYFTYYDESIRKELFEEQFITSTMKSALEKEEFQVYYQPKYDLHTEMVAGAEALVRWIHPERGMLSPGLFIPLFEKNGFITQLDRYVWEVACRDIRSWMDKGYPPVPVSVNVSRADIFNPKLPQILTDLVEKYRIPMAYLHLEITESAYTDNPQQIVTAVGKLHDLGFIIEMDDFGSGYSSLNMLAELPVDVLKLDMRFVQMEANYSSGRGIMSFVISLAKWMKLSVIAEGVETAEQIISLRTMDCNFVQGFYYAKPMPKADFEVILNTVAISQLTGIQESEAVNKKTINQKHQGVMLIVDDIEVNRAVLDEIFCREYQIVEKENGMDALEYLMNNSEKVDVILLDLLMPVMDGFQLLQKIRTNAALQNIPVVVTSQGDMTAEERALDLGADDFISKPYSPQIVYHRVANIVKIYNRHEMQQKILGETKKKEQILLDSIPGGMAIYHVKNDGRMATEYVSDGLASLCGYSSDEFLSYLSWDARVNIEQEELSHLNAAVMAGIKTKDTIHDLQRIYTKDKQTILVRMDANVVMDERMEEGDLAVLYAVYTKSSEEQMHALEEQLRYRYILDNLDVAYFEKNQDGTFYASDKYSLYAMSEDKDTNIFVECKTYKGIHPEDLPVLFEFFKQREKMLPKICATLRLKMKDGSYRWTQLVAFFEYHQGECTKSMGILRDVDKEWLNQNRKLQDALEMAQKASQSKTDFLARISHEVRTPLNGIVGLAELIRHTKDNRDISTDLVKLEESSRYLLSLINDTLDVSAIEKEQIELHPTVCDGKLTLANVMSMVKPRMEEKKLNFETSFEELPFTKLYIDVGRVQQIFINILNNAIKFAPIGGTVKIRMENISRRQGLITDKVVITDNGIGMSKEFLDHAFEPFSQEHNGSKSIYSGAGLGLTIAKQCVELMGGSIDVESKEGCGTKVTVVLPLPVATKEQIEDWNHTREEANLEVLKGKRILLCEDHPLNAEIAIRLLERKGMIVEHAYNGKKGVDMFMASKVHYYDTILMDIRMPVMNGLEATKKIRHLSRSDAKTIPIIAMTANVLSEDVKDSINAGMSEHMGKPVEPDKLYHTIAKLIMEPSPFAGKKILVVDDIEMNRAFVKAAIKDVYTVLEAGSGKEALEVLANEKDITAVVTDIQMPFMDGKELIRQIRKNPEYDDVAILANTIYGDHRQEDELISLGANDFVYKPASAQIILMRLEHILRNIND